ncbi:alpha/beta fold hydrolase [Nocardia sp. BMG111209]|uniref:alpha/beta fold hydrolase n=1 Tax=Nocardia sp. BMG111209 TaxID=1160137 RepID=UPI000360FC69|nr:alpha/beta hydrolase [Nocardia sp. BMG111209]
MITPTTLGTVDLTVADHDRTRTYLLLHGGGGPATMAAFAGLLAERARARVLVPTHPGFAGTPRPAEVGDVAALADLYLGLLDRLELRDVTLVGNSFGGWLAAEMALRGNPRVTRAVVVDAVGIEVDDQPITDISGMSPAEVRTYSFHDPSAAPVPPPGVPAPAPDLDALTAYTGPTMTDPTLRRRLAELRLPVDVVWGDSDRIVRPGYGRAYAAAIPGATFTLLPGTGHMPQIETPAQVLDTILR